MKSKIKQQNLLIITGLSGAGKTKCTKILEDLGYYCVDNLPIVLLSEFASWMQKAEFCQNRPTAVVIDVRGGEQFQSDLTKALIHLETNDIPYTILFLEAQNEILVRRFSETRRKHPVVCDGGILASINLERQYMQSLRERANYIIDTSLFTLKEFRERVLSIGSILGQAMEDHMMIHLISFGYKNGIPIDADIVIDVRFLPNPFYETDLKELTGVDSTIQDYVIENDIGREFVDKFSNLLLFLIPLYQKEGKSQITIAFGCTGGKHRSVTVALLFQQILEKNGYSSQLTNRDIQDNDDLSEKI
jgi:UPF0042 nucleotide-binding protein